MADKFKRGNSQVKTFDDFSDQCCATTDAQFGSTYKVDKAADDLYLKSIVRSRGAVKSHAITDPLTRSAIDYRIQMAVGTTIRIKPNVMWQRLGWTEQQNRDVRRQARELWKMYMESDHRWSDAAGLHTITEQAAQHARIFEVEGEAMAAVYELGEARRSPLSFAIGNIDPDKVRTPRDLADDAENRRISEGKLVSRRGYPLGFYVHDYHRRDSKALSSDTDNYQFVPTRNSETGREQFIHSYAQITSDLSRGISSLAACMTLSCQKADYINASLEDAISKAGLSFIIKSAGDIEGLIGAITGQMRDEDKLFDYMEKSKAYHDTLNLKHKNNRIARLLHGEDMEGFSADQAGGATFEVFSETIDTIAASCHGLSVEEYRQRWNDTNYSGARSGKLYMWEMVKKLQAEAPWKFVRKAYCLFFEDMVLQGKLKLPNLPNAFQAWEYFLANKEALTCVEFFGSAKPEIDRAKTADGYLAEGQMGVATWEAYCNEVLGVDWEDRLEQIIEEVKTTYEFLVNCQQTPSWTISDMVTHRLFGGNAFLARKELRELSADPDDESGGTTE